MLHAFDLGLAKIMSKMGISVVDSYRSAHLFDVLGLDGKWWSSVSQGRRPPISGIGFAELEAALRERWSAAQDDDSQPALVNAVHQDSQPPHRDRPTASGDSGSQNSPRLRLGSIPQRRACRAACLAAPDRASPASRGRYCPCSAGAGPFAGPGLDRVHHPGRREQAYRAARPAGDSLRRRSAAD